MNLIENYLGVLILLLFCFLVSSWEKQRDGTVITPFGLLAWPYAIVVAMINLGGIYFGFFPVSLISILFVILCLLFFKFGEWFIELTFYNTGMDKKLISFNREELKTCFDKYKLLFIVLAIISIIAGIIHFHQSLRAVGGWFFIYSKEFQYTYSRGILGHIMQLNRSAFTFLCGYYFFSKKKFTLPLLILMFLSILLAQIKTHVITTFLSGILFSYIIRVIKFNFKKLVLYGFIIFIFFNLSYAVGYSRIGLINTYSHKVQLNLLYQFFTYLFGGAIGFSEILKSPTYPIYSSKEIFAVPINFYNILFAKKELVDVIVHYWIPISTNYKYFHSSNVFTLFGMLYMYIGSYATFIYMFVVGLIANFLKHMAYRKNAYIGFQLAYVFFLSFLTISFFDIYFNQLQIYHTSVLMIILPFSYDLIIKIKNNILWQIKFKQT